MSKGFAHKPYEWSPAIVDVQMLRVGNLVIIVFAFDIKFHSNPESLHGD